MIDQAFVINIASMCLVGSSWQVRDFHQQTLSSPLYLNDSHFLYQIYTTMIEIKHRTTAWINKNVEIRAW